VVGSVEEPIRCKRCSEFTVDGLYNVCAQQLPHWLQIPWDLLVQGKEFLPSRSSFVQVIVLRKLLMCEYVLVLSKYTWCEEKFQKPNQVSNISSKKLYSTTVREIVSMQQNEDLPCRTLPGIRPAPTSL
jgi:hypothetical protein